MWECRSVRGLIAASIYERLSESDRQKLDKHVARCGSCRAELASLGGFSSRIPVPEARLELDLLPRLRALRVAESSGMMVRSWHRRHGVRLSFAGLACLAAVVVLAYSTRQDTHIPTQVPVPTVAAASPLDGVIAEVRALVEQRSYARAFQVLESGLSSFPTASGAGSAQMWLADLAFTHLNWYPEAYEAYQKLAREYPDQFTSSTESISRRDLLEEARAHDFASLYALDAARRGSGDRFGRLEQAIARYPGPAFAAVAASEMARLVSEESEALPTGADPCLYAMERARDRCTDPVAIAQLNLEVGNIYLKDLNNPAKARDLYDEVAHSDTPVVADVAKGLLAKLDASDSR